MGVLEGGDGAVDSVPPVLRSVASVDHWRGVTGIEGLNS